MKTDFYGETYYERNLCEEIRFRLGGFLAAIPTFIPLTLLIAAFIVASYL